MSGDADSCLEDAQLLEVAREPSAGGPAAEAHLNQCPKCQARLLTLRPESLDATLQATVRSGAPPGPPVALSSGPLERGEMIGPYVVGELLAQGGMGVLYTAVHPELNRKVALKVIRPEVFAGDQGSSAQLRLLREAQAMAQLSHPNVVTVFDAGTAGSKVFLAMELVEGSTLRQWLKDQTRTWREKVEAFLAAGRGLAAAHRVGLIHRDFKADNVLVSRDGRVRVTDFGLARSVGAVVDEAATQGDSTEATVSGSGLTSTPMTVAGSVMGTPGFMAPEQSRGERVDARSDQFSFFASLWLALYEEFPYPGATLKEIRERSESGQPQPPPVGAPVPGRVRRVLARGLAASADQRFSTLDEGLRALQRASLPLPRRFLPALAIAGAAGVLGLIAFLGVRAARPPLIAGCDDSGASLSGVWDEAARAALRQSFLQTKDKDAELSAGNTARTLDAYATAWSTQHQASCERARSAPADDVTLSALTCLARQRTALKSLVEVLAQADTDVVHAATRAANSLTSPARCQDARILALMPKLPTDPVQRAEVETLRVRLASAAALDLAGKPKQAIAGLEPLFARAQTLGYRPLEAETAFAMGHAQGAVGNHAQSERYCTVAEKSAEIVGDDILAARAAVSLAFTVGYILGRLPESRGWIERAEVNLQRAGGDAETESKLENTLAVLSQREGKDAESIRHAERAVALNESALGPEHPTTLITLGNLAIAYQTQCRNAEALALMSKTIAIKERVVGRDAATLISPHVGVAGLFARAGRFDEADQHLDRALEIAHRAGVPEDGDIAVMRSGMRSDQGRLEEALKLAEQAVLQVTKSTGEGTTQFAWAIERRAEAQEDLQRHREALVGFERAIALIERGDGPHSISLSGPLGGSGAAWVGLKKPQTAIPLLERGLEVLGEHCADPGQRAQLRFTLAQALTDAHRDGPRVKELAAQAREELAALPWKKADLDRLDGWLRAQHIALGPRLGPKL